MTVNHFHTLSLRIFEMPKVARIHHFEEDLDLLFGLPSPMLKQLKHRSHIEGINHVIYSKSSLYMAVRLSNDGLRSTLFLKPQGKIL
jgi:hypothetical protein